MQENEPGGEETTVDWHAISRTQFHVLGHAKQEIAKGKIKLELNMNMNTKSDRQSGKGKEGE